jgi:hypothetical protein
LAAGFLAAAVFLSLATGHPCYRGGE